MVETISWCNKLKNNIILQDPFEEKGSRQILNFGHTLGHALEAVSQYKLLHGEGVAVGMLYAMLIGLEKKKLQQNNIDEAIVLMRELHLLD